MVELFLKLGFSKRQANRLAREYPDIDSLMKAIEGNQDIFNEEQVKIIREHFENQSLTSDLSSENVSEEVLEVQENDENNELAVVSEMIHKEDSNKLSEMVDMVEKEKADTESVSSESDLSKTSSEENFTSEKSDVVSEDHEHIEADDSESILNEMPEGSPEIMIDNESEKNKENQKEESDKDLSSSFFQVNSENLSFQNFSSSQPIRHLFYNTSGISYFVMLSTGRTYHIYPYSQFEVSKDIAEDPEFKKLIDNFTIIKLY